MYLLALGETCPGFDDAGVRIPSAWSGSDITPATKASWKVFISKHKLDLPRAAGGKLAPNFD